MTDISKASLDAMKKILADKVNAFNMLNDNEALSPKPKKNDVLGKLKATFDADIIEAQKIGLAMLESLKLGLPPENVIKFKSDFDALLKPIPRDIKLNDIRILFVLSRIKTNLAYYKSQWEENGVKLGVMFDKLNSSASTKRN